MNWDRTVGSWKKFKGRVKEEWGKLTDDHRGIIAGKRDQLAGRVQVAYGISKDQAQRQIKVFQARNKGWMDS